VLDGNTSHPSALEVFNQVAKDYPAIALATVYNTLDALSKKGMLRELPITKDKINYDPDTSEHDHAYCAMCGRIFDIVTTDECAVRAPQSGVMEGANLISVRKIYYIECKDCREKKGRRGKALDKAFRSSND